MTEARVGRIIAVGGGKGGVGKSLISTNLAVALARQGAKVVMLDADLGAPNLHTMFGIMRPQRTVDDFLAARSSSLDEVALQTRVPGLRLICGAGGALGSANPSAHAKQRLLDQLARLPADILLVDVGAGVDLDTIDFFNAADTRLVVMVPEITSLQNGYAFLKLALFRRLQRAIAGVRASERVTSAFGKEAFEIGSSMDRVSTFFSLLEDEVPDLVDSFRLLLAEFNAQLIGNMLYRPEDRNALFAMQRVIRDRLSIQIEISATVRQNAGIRNSVNSGQPFAAAAAHTDPDAGEIRQLAARLLAQDLSPIRKLRAEFLRAMHRVPLDPDLDKRFQFGLQGVEATSRAVVDAPVERLATDLRQLQRASERIKLYVPIEVNFDGHWYMGQLVDANERGASITGIRAPESWQGARGALRVVGDPKLAGIPIAMHGSDPGGGQIVVQFGDATVATALLDELRRRTTRRAS